MKKNLSTVDVQAESVSPQPTPVNAHCEAHTGSIFDAISQKLLVLLVFVLPFLFSWNGGVADEVVKRGVLAVGVTLAFLSWLVARLQDGTYDLPRSSIFIGALAALVAALAATFFSPVIRESLIGIGIEGGTLAMLLISFVVLFLTSIYARERKHLFQLYAALGASACVLLVVELFHVAFGVSFGGLLVTPSDNFLGKWNDLGLFFGLLLLLCQSGLQLFDLPGRSKVLLRVLLVLSTIVLFFVNLALAWILVGVLSLITVVYSHALRVKLGHLSTARPDRATFTSSAVLMVVLSILAVLGNSAINQYVLNPLQLGGVEVRPSWSSTVAIGKQTWSTNPLLGSGLNRFAREWNLHKPEGVNETVFWNTDFNAGVGLVPTFGITSGILGGIAWAFFLLAFLWVGFRSLFAQHSDHTQQSIRYLAFAGSLYLWLVAFFYVPDAVLWFLAFVFLALLVASQSSDGKAGVVAFQAGDDPRASFAATLVCIVLILIDLGGGYFLVRRYHSLYVYQKALSAYAQSGNLPQVEQALLTTIARDGSQDLYYRSLVDADLLKLNQILSQANTADKEALRAQFQAALSAAIAHATTATQLNSLNYQNWMSLARVYEAIVPLKIEGAYELARQTYAKAQSLYPTNPQIHMNFARLELAKGDKKAARKAIADALEVKTNYTEALFLISQMDYDEGNITGAIAGAEQVAVLAPQDVGVFFQLGFLKYLERDYGGAIEALERARLLNPNYSNAKYFLGLSYSMKGEQQKAIKEFEDIAALNPDNAEVKTILRNLKSGEAALAGIGAPANAPERRPSLPVTENSSTPKQP